MKPPVRRLYWWREVLITLVLYQVYSAIRNLSEGSTRVAFQHARQLMRWQEAIAINHEQTLQSWALHSKPLIILLNYVYGSLHFLITAGVVIWLYRRHPGAYPRWRNTLALTTVLALIGFVFWPLMPPRLLPAHYGFVDTLAKYPTFWSFESGAINKISNQYAAMPSLHFGWALFCAAGLAPRLRRRPARVAAVLYPLVTLAAIVLTANHYFLDAAGGAVVFLTGYGLSRRFTRAGPVVTDPEKPEATPSPPDAAEGEGTAPSPSGSARFTL
ncbi:MAG TPA: phosphatase PAP2 family protein [Acidimicrobiia bacterium]|nr:phosphatase PAP2 family protein [Acidimicrobiia bacterium]